MTKKIIGILLILLWQIILFSQSGTIDTLSEYSDSLSKHILVTNGDTLYITDLNDFVVTTPRTFSNDDEFRLYLRYRRCAVDVYPYAKEAVDTYRRIQEETQDLKKGKRRKYIRNLNKEYKSDYKETFKNMTRTQGKVMIKMIERELNMSFYDLIKEVKGGFTATYWNALSSLYGYHLKDKYEAGEEPILDMVLDNYNLGHK
mgnify:CR=1 FL=1